MINCKWLKKTFSSFPTYLIIMSYSGTVSINFSHHLLLPATKVWDLLELSVTHVLHLGVLYITFDLGSSAYLDIHVGA